MMKQGKMYSALDLKRDMKKKRGSERPLFKGKDTSKTEVVKKSKEV